MTKLKDDSIPVLTDADWGQSDDVDVPVLGEDAFPTGQPIASKADKPPAGPKLSTMQKLGSSAATGAIRAAGVPVDIASLLPNIPSLGRRGLAWLVDKLPDDLPHKAAAVKALQDQAAELSPDKVNAWLRPHTTEGQLEILRQHDVIPPDYKADTTLGGLGKASLERGPAMFTGGAMFGMPKTLNAMTALTAPVTGQVAANIGGEKYGEPMRAGAEILTSLALPPAAGLASAAKREWNLTSRQPISELANDPDKIRRAMPWVREMVQDRMTQPTRDTVLRHVQNPDQANAALGTMRPHLEREMTDELTIRANAARQQQSAIEQQALAAQAGRSQAARQAEADALALEQQLRQPGRIRESEDIGAALHGEAVGAKDALKQNVLDPLYDAPWRRVVVDPKQVQGVVDEIDSINRILARKKATGSANPSGLLETQLNKLVSYDDMGNRVVNPVRAEVLDQIRRELDASLEALGKSEKTVAKALNVELQPVRQAINTAFDTTPNLNVTLKRMGDEAFASTAAPLNTGVAKKVLSDKATPSTTGQTLVPSGLTGREAVDELDKLVAAQAKAGVPSSDIHGIVQEQIQRNLLNATKEGDLAGGLAHTLSDKGYGPFLRNYDARYGTTLTDDLKQQLAIQQAKQGTRDAALTAEREGIPATNSLVTRSAAERDAAIREAERSVAEAIQTRMAGADFPVNELSSLMRGTNSSREINSLINSAAKSGQTQQMYEALTGALQRDLADVVAGGAGFGTSSEIRELTQRYSDALRRVGAPQGMIDNVAKVMDDADRLQKLGNATKDAAGQSIRGEKQLMYGLLGRQGGLLQMALGSVLGSRDVAFEIARLAMKDPKIAEAMFSYKGKNPEHFMKYIAGNPALSAALASARGNEEAKQEKR